MSKRKEKEVGKGVAIERERKEGILCQEFQMHQRIKLFKS